MDNSTTIDSLSLNGCGVISYVEVDVDIAHTYIGDLTVVLSSPNGTQVVLHNATGGNANDISGTYADSGGDFTPAQSLAGFNGAASGGTWTFSVSDSANGDSGTLNSWGVYVECI